MAREGRRYVACSVLKRSPGATKPPPRLAAVAHLVRIDDDVDSLCIAMELLLCSSCAVAPRRAPGPGRAPGRRALAMGRRGGGGSGAEAPLLGGPAAAVGRAPGAASGPRPRSRARLAAGPTDPAGQAATSSSAQLPPASASTTGNALEAVTPLVALAFFLPALGAHFCPHRCPRAYRDNKYKFLFSARQQNNDRQRHGALNKSPLTPPPFVQAACCLASTLA